MSRPSTTGKAAGSMSQRYPAATAASIPLIDAASTATWTWPGPGSVAGMPCTASLSLRLLNASARIRPTPLICALCHRARR